MRFSFTALFAVLAICCAFDETHAQDADTGGQNDGAAELKAVVVDSSADNTGQGAASTTRISADEFQQRSGGDINSVLRSAPGTFTRQGAEQPGVIVNIRGMQGMGRVNTMIDGVPQTFRNLSGHGGSFDNLAYVDPNLLVGADIARGAVDGASGLGTLSGSANLRTIGIDDVLLDGKTYGGLTTLKTGSNGQYFSRLTAGGWRADVGDGGEFYLMGALSGSNQGNFRNGDGIEYPYDSSQSPRSGLFKVGISPNDEHSLQLGAVDYRNSFAVESAGYDWSIRNRTYTAKYAYTPGNDLIDLRVNAYANITDIAMTGEAGGVFDGRAGTDTALGFDISNTSLVSVTDETELRFYYGGAYQSDDYKGNDARGANPDGTLVKSGAFADATLTRGIVGLTAGIRYDAWNLKGVTGYEEPGTGACSATATSQCAAGTLSRNGGDFNPKLGVTVDPLDWLQLYGTFAYTMRPPTASEMFYPGGHNFDGTGDPIANNPDLKPERQQGLDIGVRLSADGVFSESDSAHLKIGYFRNRISDYITYAYDRDGQARWVNLPGETIMKGVEVEGGYDTGRAYANLSLTIADTSQPLGLGAGFGNDVGTLPDDFATLDGGMRFLDERLTLGGRVKYTGRSIQAYMTSAQTIHRPSYTLVDLYGSMKFNNNFSAFFSVENVFDRAYWAANTGTSDIFQTISNGRGRTFVIGATARF